MKISKTLRVCLFIAEEMSIKKKGYVKKEFEIVFDTQISHAQVITTNSVHKQMISLVT